MIGATLAHYRVTAALGAGGMGEVWLAEDEKLGRQVALKVLPEGFAQDPERMARFEREAKVLASLNHPSIASIYGFHEQDGVRFLAMELAPGPDLSERIDEGPIPIEDALLLAMRIAEGLEYAHERNIVHRDLKPSNVKVSQGAVKVLDFGLAKAFTPEGKDGEPTSTPTLLPTVTSAGTGEGMILGTAA
ncbi:MAG: serine/threonine protein kinase, partial [Acidobacteria bacterium]|nr:serine/threonine protein kinase [Acidobacteriota bacterium]